MIQCNVATCVGCKMCEVACSSFHFGAVSPAMARIRVAKLEEIGIDMAVACVSCLEKPCLECPTGALSVGEKGEILLDMDLCTACEQCVEDCPVGAINLYNDVPLFCDLCDGAISCIDVCPSDALSYREDNREDSLQIFLQFEGNPSQKRAYYVRVQAEPIRERWKNGIRIDS